jgi:hypothetical protein
MDGWTGQVMRKASRRPLLYVIVKVLGVCEMMEGTQKRAKACTYFEETSMGREKHAMCQCFIQGKVGLAGRPIQWTFFYTKLYSQRLLS